MLLEEMASPCVLSGQPGPPGPQQETSRGLQRKWVRGSTGNVSPAVFTAKEGGQQGQRTGRGHCLVTL